MARSAAKRFIGTLLFVVAFFAVLGFAFILFADATNADTVPGVDAVPNLALVVTILLAIAIVLIILLLIVRRYDQKEEETEGAEPFFVPDADRAAAEGEAGAAFDQAFEDTAFHATPDLKVYDLASLDIEQNAWDKAIEDDDGKVHPFKFPRDAPDAVFTHDYIPIGGGARLKMSTLLAGPAELPQITVQPKGAEKADEPVGDAEDLKEMLAARERQMEESGELDAGYEGLMSEEEHRAEVFYHFPGDPVELAKMDSVGAAYAEKLAQHGVKTTHRLAFEETDQLAALTDIDATLLDAWKAEADLSLVSGIGAGTASLLADAGIDMDALKKKSAGSLHKQVAQFVEEDGRDATVPSETKFETWKEAAKELRRRRMDVPEQ